MKKTTNRNFAIRSGLALAVALIISSPMRARSEDPVKETTKMDGKMMMGGKMMSETDLAKECVAMKGQAEKMMADMKAQDTEIAAEVAKMNAAPEDKKLELMSAVVTRMVEQRTAMHSRMETMQAGMMNHMMQHMQMGKDSMAQCPMMKGMHEKSTDAHKEHKAE